MALENRLDYQIQNAPCVITGQFTKVITVNQGQINFTLDTGETGSCDVFGQFSEEGLEMMLAALRAAPMPIPPQIENLPEITLHNLKYGWHAFFNEEETEGIIQFEADDRINHFGHFDPHRVVTFYLRPRDGESRLPSYCWRRRRGLYRADWGCEWQSMGFPWPEVPFHLEYERRVIKVLTASGARGVSEYPTQVRHEIGWRVDMLHGDDHETSLIIGIEDDDGSSQIVKWEPAESRHLQNKRIHASVLIVDMVEAPAA